MSNEIHGAVIGFFQHFGGDQAFIMSNQDPVDTGHGTNILGNHPDIMSDDDDSHALIQLLQQIIDIFLGSSIYSHGWLIQKKNFRVTA